MVKVVGVPSPKLLVSNSSILTVVSDSLVMIGFLNYYMYTGLLRCGKSCRLRWINYLRPDLKRGNFTEEEDELIIKLHSLLGNKWSLIAGRLPGRTDNEIKNYWNTHIKRKLISRGIDPQTHRPLTEAANNTNNNAAKATAIATTATAPTELNFRNAPRVSKSNFITTPSLDFKHNNIEFQVKAKTESLEEGNCSSSGMTTDEEQPQQQQHKDKYPSNGQELNLELSIGISSPGKNSTMLSSAESKPKLDNKKYQVLGQAMVAKGVCLCWQLGFQRSAICRNCQNTNGFYRYCTPLDS
ncbi:hypothetical protein PTKIN_Ptkin09bG0077700 [Pterospermum kingtungense]